jgi:hypothetical protein
VGNVSKAYEMGGQSIVEIATKKDSTALRKTRQKKGQAGVLDGEEAYKRPWAAYKVDKTPAPEPEELESGEEYEEDSIIPTIHESRRPDDMSHEKASLMRGRNMTIWAGVQLCMSRRIWMSI